MRPRKVRNARYLSDPAYYVGGSPQNLSLAVGGWYDTLRRVRQGSSRAKVRNVTAPQQFGKVATPVRLKPSGRRRGA